MTRPNSVSTNSATTSSWQDYNLSWTAALLKENGATSFEKTLQKIVKYSVILFLIVIAVELLIKNLVVISIVKLVTIITNRLSSSRPAEPRRPAPQQPQPERPSTETVAPPRAAIPPQPTTSSTQTSTPVIQTNPPQQNHTALQPNLLGQLFMSLAPEQTPRPAPTALPQQPPRPAPTALPQQPPRPAPTALPQQPPSSSLPACNQPFLTYAQRQALGTQQPPLNAAPFLKTPQLQAQSPTQQPILPIPPSSHTIISNPPQSTTIVQPQIRPSIASRPSTSPTPQIQQQQATDSSIDQKLHEIASTSPPTPTPSIQTQQATPPPQQSVLTTSQPAPAPSGVRHWIATQAGVSDNVVPNPLKTSGLLTAVGAGIVTFGAWPVAVAAATIGGAAVAIQKAPALFNTHQAEEDGEEESSQRTDRCKGYSEQASSAISSGIKRFRNFMWQ